MCYSAGMSFSLAAVGAIASAAALADPTWRRQLRYVPLIFYTCMELLQGVQYSHVNECGTPANRFSTEVAYLLVVVQPLMWNLLYYLRTPANNCDRRLFVLGMVLAVIWIAFHVAGRLLHGASGFVDRTHGANTYTGGDSPGCTMRDPGHHLYWKWASADLGGLDATWLMYLMIWFLPALVSGCHRLHMAFGVAGAALAAVVTWRWGSRVDEFASVWCLFSIPLLVLGLLDLAGVRMFKAVRGRM